MFITRTIIGRYHVPINTECFQIVRRIGRNEFQVYCLVKVRPWYLFGKLKTKRIPLLVDYADKGIHGFTWDCEKLAVLDVRVLARGLKKFRETGIIEEAVKEVQV